MQRLVRAQLGNQGIDLRQGGQVARLGFDAPLATAGEARKVLVALVAKARAA